MNESKRSGSTLEALFDETGDRDELEARTKEKMVALQLRARMQATKVTKTGRARHAMKSSRSAGRR